MSLLCLVGGCWYFNSAKYIPCFAHKIYGLWLKLTTVDSDDYLALNASKTVSKYSKTN